MDESGASGRRKKTARFIEIAEAAGVSPSTVDRVLNERGSVAEGTRARVIAAARHLGIPRLLPDSAHALVHIDVILPKNTSPFFQRLNLALQRNIQMLDRRIIVHRTNVAITDEKTLIEAILNPPYRRQGLIITAPDTEGLREALRRAIARGEAVVTLMTDIGGIERTHYAGVDNYKAGRTAGYFIGRLARSVGRILLLCGRSDYRVHIDRTRGCRDVITESFPNLFCDNSIAETNDDPDRCYLAVIKALREYDDIIGIYNSGAGSPGVDAALRRFNATGKIIWVTHEISDEHRQYLAQRTLDLVIDQNPDGMAVWAIQFMMYACGVVEHAPPASGTNEFRLYCAENTLDASSRYLP